MAPELANNLNGVAVITDELKPIARAAEVLFLLAFVLALATLALNRALSDNRREHETRYEEYRQTGSMLGRVRLLRDQGPHLYEGVVLAALTPYPPFPDFKSKYPSLATLTARGPVDLVREPADGSISMYTLPGNQKLWSSLQQGAERFGVAAADIFAAENDTARRILLLNAAVDASFQSEEARRYLRESVTSRLAHIGSVAQWPYYDKSSWIVYGEWPPRGGVSGGPAAGITYADRFVTPYDFETEKIFLSQAIGGAADAAEAEKILDNAWREAYARFKDVPVSPPHVGVPSAGGSLRATDIVMLGGPLLVVTQAFFTLFWVRYWSLAPNPPTDSAPFIFPVFGSPVDPFARPMPRDITEVTRRLIWTVSLILPMLTATFAILTRYDVTALVADDWRTEKVPWIVAVLGGRTNDLLSLMLDAANVVSLLISAALVVRITSANQDGILRQRNRWLQIATVVTLLLWLFLLWYVFTRRDATGVTTSRSADLAYWFSFGSTWLLAMFMSISYRARLPLVVSAIGLLLFIVMFAPV